jgi:hypothetical protein
MPAFTFEKIKPPVHHAPQSAPQKSPVPPKQRGIIVQILDRFVERRVKKSLRRERRAAAHDKAKSAD